MKDESFKCDICFQPKQETNGWWGARFHRAVNELVIRPWHDWAHESEPTHHLCGQGCAMKLTERYLEGRM